jgi:hypothetical protein
MDHPHSVSMVGDALRFGNRPPNDTCHLEASGKLGAKLLLVSTSDALFCDGNIELSVDENLDKFLEKERDVKASQSISLCPDSGVRVISRGTGFHSFLRWHDAFHSRPI